MGTTDCPLCRIAAGDLPAHVVHRSEHVLAFLDIRPIRPAHVLIIPRDHHAYFDAVPPPVMTEIMALAQRLAPILRAHAGVERVACMFSGIDLPHAHAHVFPMHETSDITSRQAIVEEQVTIRAMPLADPDELREIAQTLRRALASSSDP